MSGVLLVQVEFLHVEGEEPSWRRKRATTPPVFRTHRFFASLVSSRGDLVRVHAATDPARIVATYNTSRITDLQVTPA